MKNLFLTSILVAALATSAFATGESNINYFILNNFRLDYRGATNVEWVARPNYAKATFMYNNQKTEAFYNTNGQLIASSKAIKLDELPVSAKRAFAKKYEGYTVKEAIEFVEKDEVNYYVSAENDKEKVVIKVDENDLISTFSKTKK